MDGLTLRAEDGAVLAKRHSFRLATFDRPSVTAAMAEGVETLT